MSGANIWMPLYIADYLADTAHLTQAQHGAYLLLLMAMWRRGGRLPDDDKELAAITRSTRHGWKQNIRPALATFFLIADGAWTQRRLTKELQRAVERYKTKVENGRKGGFAKGGESAFDSADQVSGDRLATGSDSLGQSPGDRVLQPQPQPHLELLSVGVSGSSAGVRQRGRS